jgi:hypothetical protein
MCVLWTFVDGGWRGAFVPLTFNIKDIATATTIAQRREGQQLL